MKPNSPTHDAITLRAQEIWNARGAPHGADDEIWLEAERQLATEARETTADFSGETRASFDPFGRNRAGTSGKAAAIESGAPDPLETAAKAALQKHAASAPRHPSQRNVPSAPVPTSGKPLWDKPHSS